MLCYICLFTFFAHRRLDLAESRACSRSSVHQIVERGTAISSAGTVDIRAGGARETAVVGGGDPARRYLFSLFRERAERGRAFVFVRLFVRSLLFAVCVRAPPLCPRHVRVFLVHCCFFLSGLCSVGMRLDDGGEDVNDSVLFNSQPSGGGGVDTIVIIAFLA